MPIFETISVWLKEVLLPYGGFGLMGLAVCDSSFVSLPEVNDILLMTFSISNPAGMVTYATLTTLGSLIGCSLLYGVGRKGGEAFLRRTPRMTEDKLVRMQNWYRRHGVLAVIIPSLLPPPTPFKIFVLSAGAFGISWPKFIAAVVVGRGIRYFSEGILAVIYGPAAIEFVGKNYGMIGLGLAILIVASAVVYFFIARRRIRSIEA
ncbi:MAG TPA: VTT domain-containing protein [Terriglobia bacterium]|nr:VTT domain-containing protein [Terriglobia bacterium]